MAPRTTKRSTAQSTARSDAAPTASIDTTADATVSRLPARIDPPPTDDHSSIPPDAELRRGDVDEWGRSEKMRRIARTAYEPIYSSWFRTEWEGFEHIPKTGGALLVANHAGAVPSDAPVIMHGIERDLGRPVYGLAENLFRTLPFAGTMWSRFGGVNAHPDNAYRLLHDQQQLVLVFPEGVKGPSKLVGQRYRLQRFGRGGFVEIAMRAGVPIIPIAVTGNEETAPIIARMPGIARQLGLPYLPLTPQMLVLGPLGALVPLPAKFRLRVLPPVKFDVPPDQERYSPSRVMAAAERIKDQIQSEVFTMLAERTNWVVG